MLKIWNLKSCKKNQEDYKKKYHDLRFDLDETSALKEELEDRVESQLAEMKSLQDAISQLRGEIDKLKSSESSHKKADSNTQVELISFDDVVPNKVIEEKNVTFEFNKLK